MWWVQTANFHPGISQYEQTNDSGNPVALKGKSHINWTQATMVVHKDHQWISLPLAKPRQSNPVHLANEISVNQINQILKRKEVGRAFLGIIRVGIPNERHLRTCTNEPSGEDLCTK